MFFFFPHIEKVEFAQITHKHTDDLLYLLYYLFIVLLINVCTVLFVLYYLICTWDYLGNYGSEDEAEMYYSMDTMIYSSTDH